MIQSSVNGIIDIIVAKFFTKCKYAKFTTIIHDEIIFQIPIDKEKEARQYMDESVKELNDLLKWSINIRTGWVAGLNLYDAK